MEEILPGIYEKKLRDQTGKLEINIFLIPGGEDGRVLMIDAGYRTRENKEIMTEELSRMGIAWDKLDIFLTHKHHDHTGLANFYADRGARIYMNPLEDRHSYDCIYFNNNPKALEEQEGVLRTVGVTKERNPELLERFMEMNRQIQEQTTEGTFNELHNYQYLHLYPGDEFRYGDYCFRVFQLRGHTYGQMGLYDLRHKIVFSADQFIDGIIPIVGTSYIDENLLGEYFETIETFKIRFRNFMIYPAHNAPFLCDGATAGKILSAYQNKLNTIFEILFETPDKSYTVQELAFLAYGIRQDYGWENLIQTKMIITKTFSCLEYLYNKHMISRSEEKGTLLWTVRSLTELDSR